MAARGLASVDADSDPELARWVDVDGKVAERPDAPDTGWMRRHRWMWNPGRLDELISAATPATLFVCGNAANETELLSRFDRAFLLVIDEPTMLARLDAPGRDNDFGRVGDSLEQLRRWLPGYQERLLASGAMPIDAAMPLERVADAILAACPPEA